MYVCMYACVCVHCIKYVHMFSLLVHINILIASLQEHQFHPVEVKYGLLQLAEGLSFLHNDARLFHGNLTPESVIINHKGEWKLGGFHFCCYTQYTSSAQVSMYLCTWLQILFRHDLTCQYKNNFCPDAFVVEIYTIFACKKMCTDPTVERGATEWYC